MENKPKRKPSPEAEAVTRNVDALIKHAEQNVSAGPGSDIGLERWIRENRPECKVSRKTIYAIRKGMGRAPAVDTLGSIAAAYRLEAWQLLLPEAPIGERPQVLTEQDKARIEKWRASHEQLMEARKGGRKPSPRAGTSSAGAHPDRKPGIHRRKV